MAKRSGKDNEATRKKRASRAHSPHYRGDNAGGYGNPPVRGQFEHGNPGGPGRPPGQSNLESAIRKALGRRRPVNRDGRMVKMNPVDVYAERVLETILSRSKSPALLEFGLRIFEKYGPGPSAADSKGGNVELDLTGLSLLELHLYGYLSCKMVKSDGVEDLELTPQLERLFERITVIIEEESEWCEAELVTDVDEQNANSPGDLGNSTAHS